jgi:hypothetical protein
VRGVKQTACIALLAALWLSPLSAGAQTLERALPGAWSGVLIWHAPDGDHKADVSLTFVADGTGSLRLGANEVVVRWALRHRDIRVWQPGEEVNTLVIENAQVHRGKLTGACRPQKPLRPLPKSFQMRLKLQRGKGG